MAVRSEHGGLNAAQALLVVLTLMLAVTPAMASEGAHAEAEAAQVDSAAHGDAAEQAAHKEHLRHFSLMNFLISPETEDVIKQKMVKTTTLPETFIDGDNFVESKHLTHLFWSLIAFSVVLILASLARVRLAKDPQAGVLPERRFSSLLFFEVIVGAVWNLMRGMLGDKNARAYFPIIATLGVYIFVMNILALLPFGAPATDNLNTNIGMALVVFFATHYAGIKSQGIVHYAKHFMGPVLGLAPLMVFTEIVGHLVRPMSLSLRLMGNMTGDHNVLFEFAYFKIPLVPLPVMALGLLVCVVQALVFVILSTVYLSIATTGDDAEAHGH